MEFISTNWHKIISLLLAILAGFLCGSVPFGYLIVRAKHKVDIRSYGSGNIGMTNVWRNFGAFDGISVMILDIVKGLVPVLIFPKLFNVGLVAPISTYAGAAQAQDKFVIILQLAVGVAAILGHTFSPWINFKGGKGVATGAGMMLGIFKLWTLIPIGVFVLVFLLSRIVSLASLIAVTVVAIIPFLISDLHLYRVFGVLCALFIFWTHRENIVRLVNGKENRFGKKNSSEKKPEPAEKTDSEQTIN